MLASDENLVFNAVTLPTSYQSSGASVSGSIEIRSYGQFTLIPIYTEGASETGNVCEIEISVSPDGTNWAIYGSYADAGSGQMNATKQYFNIAQSDPTPITFTVMGRWIRFRLKEEGVVTNAGTLSLYLYSRPLGS